MPNSGSDCCGTCWFNAKSKGEAGYGHATDPQPAFCTIRRVPIADPFYTYCGNHPHRRPERDLIPIGPVFTGEERERCRQWVGEDYDPTRFVRRDATQFLRLADARGVLR